MHRNHCTMKQKYHSPQTELILIYSESGILAGSINQDSNPVIDAAEGDTGYWGEWF